MSKVKLWKAFREKFLKVFITFFTIIVFVLILNNEFWSKTNIRGNLESVEYVEPFWTITDSSTGKIRKANEVEKFTSGNVYTLSTVLTYDGTQDEIPYGFLKESHLFIKVLLDGKEIFSYMPEDVKKRDKGKSSGFVYIDFPLPHFSKGKRLDIIYYPVLEGTYSYKIGKIYFGNYKNVIHSMIKRDLPHNIITLLCMLLGVAALIYSAISLKGDDFREGFNIGAFSLLVSCYFMTECSTNNYFFNNPYYMYFLNYLCFCLMPVSFMCVMRECLDGKQKNIASYVIVIEIIVFIIEILLHLTGVKDMKEILPLTHVIDFATIILISYFLATMKNKEKKISLQLQLLPVSFGMLLDLIIYWGHLNIGVNDATFSTIGTLIFLFKELMSKMIGQSRRITSMQRHTIEGMARLIESRDGSTGEHVRNTGVYAQMIAEELYRRRLYKKEINIDFVDMIGRMAPLHDVGKIKISDTILNKPGALTEEEYEIMKTHAELGGEIIKNILQDDLDPKMLRMAENIATYHHERWDGKGYPKGLKGNEIPLEARIMSVADVFDALNSKRIYKNEMNIDDVFNEMIDNEGKQFEKQIMEVFVSLKPQIIKYLSSVTTTPTKAFHAISIS